MSDDQDQNNSQQTSDLYYLYYIHYFCLPQDFSWRVRNRKKILISQPNHMLLVRERSGSVVECLTRDRRAAGSSLTGVTVLCP